MECFLFSVNAKASLKFLWALGGLSGSTQTLGHSEGTQALGHLRHSGNRTFRALRHLGT